MAFSYQRSTTPKTRRTLRSKSGRTHATRQISPKNRKALKLLAAWVNTPDDRGAGWWQQFERELSETRLSFHAE